MAQEEGLTVLREREMMPVGGSHAAYIDARRDVIVETFIPETFRANAALVGMFLDLCKARGLNPFAKQIYVIPRGRKPSIEIAIDGYRLIAARAPGYAGLDEYEYDATAAEHPEWARCTVYKLVGGLRCPFTARVLWKEFGAANVATDYDNQWKKRPYHMLGITAERHALRMAFPEEMGAVEAVNGELGGEESASDVPPPREVREPGKAIAQPARIAPLSAPRIKATITAAAAAPPASEESIEWSTEAQVKAIHTIVKEAGLTEDAYRALLLGRYPNSQHPDTGKPSSTQLTIDEASDFINHLHDTYVGAQNDAAATEEG